jgi:hypothetical protein
MRSSSRSRWLAFAHRAADFTTQIQRAELAAARSSAHAVEQTLCRTRALLDNVHADWRNHAAREQFDPERDRNWRQLYLHTAGASQKLQAEMKNCEEKVDECEQVLGSALARRDGLKRCLDRHRDVTLRVAQRMELVQSDEVWSVIEHRRTGEDR